MYFKKIIILLLALFLVLPSNNTHAEEYFILDNQATSMILEEYPDSKFIIAELNSGYIISQQNPDNKINYKKLLNKLALFTISEKLKENKLNLDSYIHISNDEYLKNLKLENVIQVKDLIFLLEQGSSNTLAQSVFTHFSLREPDLQATLDKLGMSDTELNKFEISDENKITAKNLAYINQQIVLNYPSITDILKLSKYQLANSEEIENNLNLEDTTIPELNGFSLEDTRAEIIIYNTDAKFVLTFLDITNDKEKFVNNLKKLVAYLSTNYHYKLILNSGLSTINDEEIFVNEPLYSLTKKTATESPVYYTMNNKLFLEQHYARLSANNSISHVTFSPVGSREVSYNQRIKEKLFNNISDTSTNKDKLYSYIEKAKLGLTLFLLFYICIYILLHFLKKQAKGR